MSKIIPHLWFDKEAVEAANFYTSLFPKSKVTNTTVLRNTPSGDCDVVSFQLWNQEFMAISAGPLFKFNPSVSFMVNFDPVQFGDSSNAEQTAREKLDAAWEKLSEGGKVLMPLNEYPFSKRYGWIQDKYGLSWQLILTDPTGAKRPAIIPSIMFVDKNAGKAEEAIDFYVSNFKDTKKGELHRYGKDMAPDKENSVMFADFMLENSWFAVMDSTREHNQFNEAISFMVQCADQKELDDYWKKLSASPANEQCGWLKDKYGLSWQITFTEMQRMMREGSEAQIDRLTQAFLPMKKLELTPLKKAYEG